MTEVKNNFKENGKVPSTAFAVFVLSITTLMSSIDTNIVNISLPTIATSLNTSFASVQWIVLGYLLAVTSLIVSIGRIGDIFGKKNIFIYGIIIFTVASLFCAIAPSIYILIIFRIVQGVGGAILMALSFAIIGDLVPKEKLVQSMGILTSMLPIGIALGPSVGGILISSLGWRSVFFFNIPIGIIAVILTLKFPNIPVVEKVKKVDFVGVILLAAILICYDFAITFAEESKIDVYFVLLIIAVIVGIIGFIIYERKIDYPLIQLDMFKNKVFSGSLAMSVLLYTVISGAILILPFYLQQGRGFSALVSGLLLASGPIGCAFFSPIAGKVANRFGNHLVMMFGIVAFGFGAFMMSLLNGNSSAFAFAVTFFFFDGGLAFFQTPNNAAIISESKPEQRGLSSALLNLSRNIGQTTGSALIGAVFYFFIGTKSTADFNSSNVTSGIHNTFIICSILMIIGFIIGMFTFFKKESLNK